MQHITEVTNDRNKRIIQANESLSPVMWMAIIGGALVIITLSFVIYMERPGLHMIMSALMASLIGMQLVQSQFQWNQRISLLATTIRVDGAPAGNR